MEIETKIQWKKPKDSVPPFDKAILVLVSGQENSYGVWNKYLKLMEVKVSKKSPCDDADIGQFEYSDFIAGEVQFYECEFYLNETNSDGFDDDEDDVGGWFSDSIVLWAESPLPELTKTFGAEV